MTPFLPQFSPHTTTRRSLFLFQYGSHAIRVNVIFPPRTWCRALLPFLLAFAVTAFAVTLMMPAYVYAGEHGYFREEDNSIWNFAFLVVTLTMPLMYTTAVTNTHAPLGCLKSCKMYGVIFLYMAFEACVGLVFTRIINPRFYVSPPIQPSDQFYVSHPLHAQDVTTPTWMKLVLRSVVHPIIIIMYVGEPL